MRRCLILSALLLFVTSALPALSEVEGLAAQSSAQTTFDVASVKVAPNQSRGGPRRMDEITLPVVRVLPGGRAVDGYLLPLAPKRRRQMTRRTCSRVFRRELGLKLVKERTTIDDFIIERIEPLIEN